MSGIDVLDSSSGVILPRALAAFSYESGWMKNFTLGGVFLGSEFNFKLGELWHIADAIQNCGYSFESICWVADLVFLQVFHLAGVGSEVLWEGCLVAKLCWQVDASIFEVNKEEWLLFVFQLYFILSKDVLGHAHRLSVSLNERVGVRVLREVKTVDLVGLRVVAGNYGLARQVDV
jgi:hypothetical protein